MMLQTCYRYMSLLVLCLGLSFLLGVNVAHAEYEQIKICGKYQRKDNSYSHGYKLTALWVDGYELSKILNSNHFNNNNDYFLLVRWKNGGFSLFKTSSQNKPIYFQEKIYKDQRDINWKIQNGWNYCN